MAERDKVLVLSLSDIALDARIRRQVDFLATDYRVVVAAVGRPHLPNDTEFLELRPNPLGPVGRVAEAAARVALRIARFYGPAYSLDARVRRWCDDLRRVLPVQAIIVNDLWALPLAHAVGEGAPVIFDAHEHWTSESASWTKIQHLSMRGAHEWIVDHHVPLTAGMMTVSPGIAREFSQRTGVRPHLVTNAPYFRSLRPSPVSEPIRLLHVGLADERRRLEDTIDAVRSLGDRFSLDLVLLRDNAYRRRLERLAGSDGRIRILPPLTNSEVIPAANSYDVGVFLLPVNFPNQVHVLPNKLFDYIQARLAVAIGPSPEMAEIVRAWNCGVVSASFTPEAFADVLGGLTIEEVERMKRNSDRAARVLTAEANRDTVISLVREAITGGRSRR
jgi:glycosyltransferase involved in cell wall biosynthesis